MLVSNRDQINITIMTSFALAFLIIAGSERHLFLRIDLKKWRTFAVTGFEIYYVLQNVK